MSLGMPKAKVRYDGKPFIYHTDGSGRDTYITRNNGGLMSQQMLKNMECKEIKPEYVRMRVGSSQSFKKSLPTLGDKFVHYHSDGTGRDSYIGWNHGGRTQVFSSKNNTEVNFRSTLRSYQKMPTQSNFFSTNNNNNSAAPGSSSYNNATHNAFDFTNTNFYLSQKQLQEKNQLHKRQIQSANRLSRPKPSYGPQHVPVVSVYNSRYNYYNPFSSQQNQKTTPN